MVLLFILQLADERRSRQHQQTVGRASCSTGLQYVLLNVTLQEDLGTK